MQIGHIQGCTRTLGKSQGYLGLPLRDIVINDTVTGPNTPAMETAWFPTPDEIAAINSGAPVILRVVGTGHPPVMLLTGEVPELDGLSPWCGWDQSRLPWSDAKHKDEVCEAVFRAPWSVEDAAMLIGFIERTWPLKPEPR